jgi:DegV family protein with EDD domain
LKLQVKRFYTGLLNQSKKVDVANVKIITDSLADIPPEILKELEITTVPCIVRFGNTEYRDRVDLEPREFYQKLAASSSLPTTSVPSTGLFEDTYRRIAQTTDQILVIHTIASLSGIYNASRLAASEFPNVRIELIDSCQVSMSLGWLVILAARAAKAGKNLDEVKAIVEDALPRTHIVAMLDSLKYAERGGRLGKGAALLCDLLNLKAILSTNAGEIVPVENVRTQKRALERLVEIVTRSGSIQELAVVHANAIANAENLAKQFAEIFPGKQIPVCETGPVLGTHTGPGAVGIAWLAGKS